MKTKIIRITVRETVGLPKFSSKSVEILEEIEVEDGESPKKLREARYNILNDWIIEKAAEIKKANKVKDD